MITEPTFKCFKKQPFYTEGPVIDSRGNWYFTNLTGGAIIRRDTKGRESTWARANCPNGQTLLTDGHHLVCDSRAAALIRFDADGRFVGALLENTCAGEIIHTPNDVISDSKGHIYFTDSIRHEGKVGRISASGTESIVARELDYPNGLAFSNDGKILFVAESYKNRILAFELNEEGKVLSGPTVWADLPQHPSGESTGNLPDGIKVDRNGHLWVAHYGMGLLHKIRGDGTLVQSLKLPFQLVSNLFIRENTIIATGGHGEPGPGALIEIIL